MLFSCGTGGLVLIKNKKDPRNPLKLIHQLGLQNFTLRFLSSSLSQELGQLTSLSTSTVSVVSVQVFKGGLHENKKIEDRVQVG